MPAPVTNADRATPLAYEWLSHDPADERPVVLLHGFTQNTRCWGLFGEALSLRHPTLAIDAPGHGGSTRIHADLPRSADLLAQSIDSTLGGPAVVVGYSMGGRLGLHLALSRPDLLQALVLIGATGGIESEIERAARQAADDALADHLLAVDIEAFIDEWLAQPLFQGLEAEAACHDERLANDADGLASSLRLSGTGTQLPLWDQLGALTMPVLVLAGSEDDKFRALGERLGSSIGSNATVEVIAGAGHAVHLERPTETATIIEHWLASQD